jgi:hypothetical protein
MADYKNVEDGLTLEMRERIKAARHAMFRAQAESSMRHKALYDSEWSAFYEPQSVDAIDYGALRKLNQASENAPQNPVVSSKSLEEERTRRILRLAAHLTASDNWIYTPQNSSSSTTKSTMHSNSISQPQ